MCAMNFIYTRYMSSDGKWYSGIFFRESGSGCFILISVTELQMGQDGSILCWKLVWDGSDWRSFFKIFFEVSRLYLHRNEIFNVRRYCFSTIRTLFPKFLVSASIGSQPNRTKSFSDANEIFSVDRVFNSEHFHKNVSKKVSFSKRKEKNRASKKTWKIEFF